MTSFSEPNTPETHPDIHRRTMLKGSLAVAAATLAGMSLTSAYTLWAADTGSTVSDQDREALIQWLIEKTKLDAKWIRDLITHAQYDATIIERITRPYESRSYAEYRPLFVHDKLATLGADYMQTHTEVFKRAFDAYGLQKEVITAILGMESHFGQHHGKDRVVDSLFTLSTGYPRRAEFFRNELAELLMLCDEEGLEAKDFKGSYAGAFGTTQFIPSSYRAYAVDADKDGKRDVWNSPDDIIHSVAHYFQRHGWDHTRPVAHWLPLIPALKAQAELGLKDWQSLASLRQHSKTLRNTALPMWKDDDKVTIINMKTDKGDQMALVHYNFYVITRWNRSYNYAMAVNELAEKMGCAQCKTS